jgi:hypothetical protein
MAYSREVITHELEGKIKWQSDKSRLIEFTLPVEGGHHLYFLPKSDKVTISMEPTDTEGNFMFQVSDWWFKKAEEFRADE